MHTAELLREETIPVLLSKEHAKKLKLKRYFDGTICKKGHVSYRYVSTGSCVSCISLRTKEWEKTPEGIVWKREYQKKREQKPEVKYKRIQSDRRRSKTKNRIDYARELRLKKKYSLSLDAFNSMKQSQHGKCMICSMEFSEKTHREDSCHVDHDHKTGKVRGLLCGACNMGIGKFKDTPELLRNAALYLERNENGAT